MVIIVGWHRPPQRWLAGLERLMDLQLRRFPLAVYGAPPYSRRNPGLLLSHGCYCVREGPMTLCLHGSLAHYGTPPWIAISILTPAEPEGVRACVYVFVCIRMCVCVRVCIRVYTSFLPFIHSFIQSFLAICTRLLSFYLPISFLFPSIPSHLPFVP